MNNLLISICIPAYNAAPFIVETINCWTKQTYRNLEIIIQDDSSKDDTFQIALELSEFDKRIKVFQNEFNLGIGKNWNKAYEKAIGDYVVIFNADDLVVDDFLEKSISYFSTYKNVDMIISSYLKSDEIKTEELLFKTKTFQGVTKNVININREHFYRIHWNYTLIKKASLEKLKNKYGLFYPTQVCDAMLWYECFKQQLTAYYTGDIAGVYRIHERNNSKIPLGEFESTLLWMIPHYPAIFKLKMKQKWNSSYILLLKYLYACLKHQKVPKLLAIRNILVYV